MIECNQSRAKLTSRLGMMACKEVCALSLLVAWGLCVAAGAKESGNSTCGVYGLPIPSPPKGAKLLQVHAVIRHGDRTPANGQMCWPNDKSQWFCELSTAEIPMYSDSEYGTVVPRVYRKVFKVGNEVLNGNCSVGQLTSIGYHQQLMNGVALKKAYVDSGFLDSKISNSEVYIRSDDKSRTLQSAESLMWGMFPPPSRTNTEVIDLITMDTEFDDIDPNPNLCPKFAQYTQEFKSSTVWKNHWNITKSLLDDLSAALNFTISEDEFGHFTDCLRTHRCHNLSWPKGMTESLYNRSWAELTWQVFTFFKYPSVSENAQVGIGFLLKELWKQMNASVDGEKVQKFFLYSGHDGTLIPILVAFQADIEVWPAYASMFLMEVYEVSGGSGHAVRLIFNGEVLQPPFCSGSASEEGLCDYKEFSNYLATITPTDPSLQCSV